MKAVSAFKSSRIELTKLVTISLSRFCFIVKSIQPTCVIRRQKLER